VERRGLRVVELHVGDVTRATEALHQSDQIEEIAHYGNVMRVATRSDEPQKLVAGLLAEADVAVNDLTRTRTTVEDAFVSMVREDGE
jgi:hypothetical protein